MVGSAMVSEARAQRHFEIVVQRDWAFFLSPCTIFVGMGNGSVDLTASWVPDLGSHEVCLN